MGTSVFPGGSTETWNDLSVLTTRGDLVYGSSGSPKGTRLGIGGANTHINSDGTDVSWQANETFAGLSPLTTRGDILYSSSGTVTGQRLAVGAAGEALLSDGTDVAWGAVSGGQTACVRVYITSNQSIATLTSVALPFAGETFDVGGFHDNAVNNSRLTVPAGEAGKYWVCARVLWIPTSVGKVECNLKINGGVAAHFSNENSNDASPGFNYDIYDLSDGDYVECVVYQNSGGTMTVQFHSTADSGVNAGTTLMMHRLS